MKAAAIVAVHNHPSGDPAPSAADVQMTKSLCEAAKLMDIDLLDHLVIGGGRYVSMKALKVGFASVVRRRAAGDGRRPWCETCGGTRARCG